MRFLLLLTALPLSAQFLEVEHRYSGMTCASCSGSLERALGRVRGVRSVSAPADRPVVRLQLDRVNAMRLEDLRDRIKGVGFTPGDAEVTLFGTLLRSEGKWRVEAKPPGLHYLLEFGKEPEGLARHEGKTATVSGVVPAASGAEAQTTIRVREISFQPVSSSDSRREPYRTAP